jgi:hypothetical protein
LSAFLFKKEYGGGDKMNKKILAIFVSLLVVALLTTPVLAIPTNGPNKVAVTVVFKSGSRTDIVDVWTGPIRHRTFTATWGVVELTITDGPTLIGTATAERSTVRVPQNGAYKVIFVDYYVFDFGDGGFEGNGKVILDGMVPGIGWDQSLARGLFQGTEAFEGQTLNIGHPFWSMPGPPTWIGYWLKR